MATKGPEAGKRDGGSVRAVPVPMGTTGAVPAEDPGRRRAAEEASERIRKRFGEGAIMRLDQGRAGTPVAVVPTGSLLLDRALGIGGYPRGRVVELFGPESGGKTTLALHAVAAAQAQGGMAAFVDAEHAFDPVYAKKLGVDPGRLYMAQPGSGEEALEVVEELVRASAFDVVVLDSVAALVPRAELEGEMGAAHVGLQARMMSQALRKLTASISRSKTVCIFINQIRLKVGVVFGSPETTTGGLALKFFSSLRIEVRPGAVEKKDDVPVAIKTKIRVVKNKLAPPFATAELPVRFGRGIDRADELAEVAVEDGVIEAAGSFYRLGKDTVARGRDELRRRFEEDAALRDKVLAALVPRDLAGGRAPGEAERAA